MSPRSRRSSGARSRSPRSSITPPKLRAADLGEDSKLGALIDGLLLVDREHGRLSKEILAAQGRLQALVDDDAHLAYLDVEAAVNKRANFMLLAVARWAFRQGQRRRRPMKR